MKNKIHTIEVENNETQSVEKIIEKIRENKIIYVKNKFYEDKDLLDSITENGPAIILNSSGSSGKPRKCFHLKSPCVAAGNNELTSLYR